MLLNPMITGIYGSVCATQQRACDPTARLLVIHFLTPIPPESCRTNEGIAPEALPTELGGVLNIDDATHAKWAACSAVSIGNRIKCTVLATSVLAFCIFL
jgi:hypothetical protein